MDVPPRRPGVSKQQHIADVLRGLIEDGTFAPGEQLPAEPELQRLFDADRGTVRRGVAVLRQSGVVETVHGRGTFVRQRRLIRHEILSVLRAEYAHVLAGTMPDRGLFEATTGVPVGHVEVAIAYSQVPASPDLAATFGVEEGTKLLCRRYIFAVDGKPHQITHSYLLAEMVDGTPLTDPDNEQPGRGTLAQLHDIGALPEYATIDIYARMPTPDEAATLGMTEGTPVLVDRRRGLFSGKVVFVADGVAPADQVKVGLDIRLAQL